MVARQIKGLNKGSGEKRFVFKSFAQRIQEIDVDVFRSLAPVKFEPTEGTSFFQENLIRWRELNSAADFSALYDELLPIVQTLPQLLLHKELIVDKLLSRLQLSAMLSLEPILSLIAVLSRDLRADFILFIPRFLDSCVELFRSGGDREPEIIEQVFTSLSYILKYMQKLLSKNIVFLLKATKQLRYYHRSYVQEFAAESVSFVLRNSSMKQLVKGVRKIFAELVVNPSIENILCCSTLFWHTLKGPASSLHSRAEPLIRLLLDISTISTARKKDPGGEVILKVLSDTFRRLGEELHREKLVLLWACLLDEIYGLMNESSRNQALHDPEKQSGDEGELSDGAEETDILTQEKTMKLISQGSCSEDAAFLQDDRVTQIQIKSTETQQREGKRVHLIRILSLLNGVLEIRRGSGVYDFKPLFNLSVRLLQPDMCLYEGASSTSLLGPLAPTKLHKLSGPCLSSEVLRFLLALIKCHHQVGGASIGLASIVKSAPSWKPIWESPELTCLLPFVRGILQQDVVIIHPFMSDLLRMFDRFIDTDPIDVLTLMMEFFQKMETTPQRLQCLVLEQSLCLQRLVSFVFLVIEEAIKNIESGLCREEKGIPTTIGTLALEPAIVWAALWCYPFILLFCKEKLSLAWDYALTLDRYLLGTSEAIEGWTEDGGANIMWEYMLGTALSSELKIMTYLSVTQLSARMSEYMGLAARHRLSPHVLKAVADFLEASISGTHNIADASKKYPPELKADKTLKALKLFENNLGMQNKLIRLSTLRILAQYEPLCVPPQEGDERPRKQRKGNDGTPCEEECSPSQNILEQLLSIEATPLSLETCRKSSTLLSRLKIGACTGRVIDCYLIPLTHAMVGVLHNKFGLLWDATVDCLAGLMEEHGTIIWDTYVGHLQSCQRLFLSKEDITERVENIGGEDLPKDLWSHFDESIRGDGGSTDAGTILTLLLRVVQKVPRIAEARSRQLVPIFLAFVGYVELGTAGSDEQNSLNRGKEWKIALKEWLNLLKIMRNARSFFKGPVLKEILINRLLIDGDPDVQLKAFECLLNWKDEFLTSYEEQLRNLISSKTLREQLTTWNVERQSQQVQVDHRPGLIPIIMRILFPKIMKTKAKSTKKSAGGVQRQAVLSFLAHLEVEELAPFFVLLLKPLKSAFIVTARETNGGKEAWEETMEQAVTNDFIEWIDREGVAALSHKKKTGFLYMVKDILETFEEEHLRMHLHGLLAFVFRILETCLENVDVEDSFVNENKIRRSKGDLGISHDDFKLPSKQVEADNGLKGSLEFFIGEHKETFETSTFQKNYVEDFLHEPHCNDELPGETETIVVSDTHSTYDLKEGKSQDLHDSQEQGESENDLDFDLNINPKFTAGMKELRSLAFKVLAIVFSKYDNLDFSPLYWKIFLGTIKPLVVHFGQESASSEAPSALFACFLAMSRSLSLASVLQKEAVLVPNVVSLISNRNASSSVVGAALSFVENIMNLENEELAEGNEGIVSMVLLPHLSVLLSNLQDLLSTRRQSFSRRPVGFHVKRELNILTQLSKYVRDPADATQLIDVLLPFLSLKKHFNQDECMEVLHVIKELSPALDAQSCCKILPFLSPLFASLSSQDIRSVMCQVLQKLAQLDPSLSLVAESLADLNALSETTIGEYDYERRFHAYDHFSSSFFAKLTYSHSLLIISHAIYDMALEDISIRHSSSNCLFTFIGFLSLEFQKGSRKENLMGLERAMVRVDADCSIPFADDKSRSLEEYDPSSENLFAWSIESIKKVVQKVLFPHVRNAMGLNSLTVRREWIILFREMVITLPTVSPLNEYLPLVSTDLEVDFFNNINHIQSHRRIRAMSRFRGLCSEGKFSQGALLRIFVPLFMNSIFEAKGDKEVNLSGAAVETIAFIASQLHWDPYFALLMRIFRLMAKFEHDKALVRLACSILDKFHFYESTVQGTQEMQAVGLGAGVTEQVEYPETEGEDCKLKAYNTGSVLHKVVSRDLRAEIQKHLQKRLLPELMKLLVSKKNMVNMSISLALVKILKLMPEEVMELELPRLIQNIVNLLKNRSQAVRDEARAAIVAIVDVLGAPYLHFVAETMESSLTRGYEVHVLGFTLNSILTKLVPSLRIGEIDYCLEGLLTLLENDMFGDVSEEKEVDKIAFKMKETKQTRSFESMRLLAQVVTFQTHAVTLLRPARQNLRKSLVPKIKLKIQMMLRHLALGMQANPSFKQEEIMVFIHGLLEDGLREEKQAKGVAVTVKQLHKNDFPLISNVAAGSKEHANGENDISHDSAHQDRPFIPNLHLITEFALQLLHNYLKRVKVNKRDQCVLAMFDPMVGLLQDCLESKYEGILSFSMRCLCLLLRLPLPSINNLGNKLISTVLLMAQKFGKIENSLFQACFNLLIVLIKHAKSAELSEEQLCMLLQFPIFIDLESSESSTGLLVLKAIVGRKFLVPEIYDMMNRVAQLMVTSQAAPVRQYCSQILLQFLLDYPLGLRRLQQHLDFFVANISYEHASGREAALEMLHAIIVKFPDQVVDEQSETLFLPLVTRLVNDDVSQVRSMVGTVLKLLMGRVSERSLQRMLNFCFSWLKGDKHQLWHPATQVLGFLVEVMKGKFSQHIQDTLRLSFTLLQHASKSECDGSADSPIGPALWQVAYYVLTMIEKLLQQFPDICLMKSLEDLWDLICTLLLHPHVWLRKVSCRLLGVYFASCGSSNVNVTIASGNKAFLMQPNRLIQLSAFLCEQLDTQFVDDSLAEQATKNLLFVTRALYMAVPNIKREASWMELAYFEDASVLSKVSKALKMLQFHSLKGNKSAEDDSLIEKVGTWSQESKEEIITEEVKYPVLLPIFKRLEKICLQVQDSKTKAIFNWYTAISTELGGDGLQPYLSSILPPLYKFSQAFAAKSVPDHLKLLAEEVLNHIKETLGVGDFVQAYNEARQVITRTREERKRLKKLNVLVDPERHAKRKIKLTVKRQAQKKRKIMESKSRRQE